MNILIRNIKHIVSVVGVFACTIFAASVHAESEADLFSLSLEDLLSVEISGATLTSESIYTTPSSVTVFSRDQIQYMGVSALYELMNLVPGFQVSRTPGNSTYGSASVRSRRIGSASAEILLVVDGQRMGTQRTGGIIDFLEMPVSGIERVEFIRGPGAALYGSNAMMGVVNIVTVSDVSEISVAGGNLGQAAVNLLYGGELGKATLDLRLDYSESSGQDFILQDSFSDGVVKATDPKQKLDVNVKANINKTQFLLSYAENSANSFYVVEYLAPDYNRFSARSYSLVVNQDFGEGPLTSNVWISYANVSEQFNSQLLGAEALQAVSLPSSSDAVFARLNLEGSEFRAVARGDWQINSANQFLFGAEWRQVSVDEGLVYSNFNIEDLAHRSFPISYYGDNFQPTTALTPSKENIVGLYGQYMSQLWENTRLTMGLRYDRYSELGDSQLSPRLGLIQTLSEHHTLKLLYGDAYRAPTPSETGLINNPATLGNPNLKAETVHSWDFIWLASFEDVSWTLGYFEHRFDNSILQVLSENSAVVKEYNNATQDPIKGVELELNYQLNTRWVVRGNYTYIADSPEATFRESKEFGSLMFNYQNGKWDANLAIAYRGERMGPDLSRDGGRREFDGYWLSYAKVQYSVSERWNFYLKGSNITNESYSFPAQGNAVPEGIPARGHEFLLGVKWSY